MDDALTLQQTRGLPAQARWIAGFQKSSLTASTADIKFVTPTKSY